MAEIVSGWENNINGPANDPHGTGGTSERHLRENIMLQELSDNRTIIKTK